MLSWLEHGDLSITDPESADVAALLSAGTRFWLDVESPTEEVIEGLAEMLSLHPLAVEDSKGFDQRGKLVVYDDVVVLVGFGLDLDTGHPIEVHGYLSKRFLVTFRRRPSATIERLHQTGSIRDLLGTEPTRVLHHLATEMHGNFEPFLDDLVVRLGLVESAMLITPRDEHLAEIAGIRQKADALRRTLMPGRDLAARAATVTAIPGATADAQLYVSDIADELQLIVADLAGVSKRCIAALGLHASLANNRQSAAGQHLAVVATVFLPITFVVGFFGMNFDVLVNDFEQGWPVFVIFGLMLNVACIIGTLWWLARRGLR